MSRARNHGRWDLGAVERERDRGPERERGAVFVVSCVVMVAVLGAATLVVDLGHGRQTKRRVQNAVDAAGLAGAALYDGSTASLSTVRTKVIAVLGVNSFPNLTATGDPNVFGCGNGETCTVRISFSPAPVATPPVPSAATRYCVKVELSDLRVNTLFAPVIGVDRLYVTALANGCRRNMAPTTIGAVSGTGGTCTQPEKSFITSGRDNLFDGDIHSSYDAKDNGNGNARTGGATYVLNVPQNNGLWNGATQVAPRGNPLEGVTSAMYAPGGSRSAPYDGTTVATDNYFPSTGDVTFTNPIKSGIYYTTGKISLQTGLVIQPHNGHFGATFVTSGGMIDISANDILLQAFNADPNRIALFSDYDEPGDNCDKQAIQASGNCIRFDGVVYAPWGKFRIAGVGNGHDYRNLQPCTDGNSASYPHTTYSGGFVSWSFEWSGNEGVLRGGAPGSSGNPDLFLDL